MDFRSKPAEIEAEQFLPDKPLPFADIGVVIRSEEHVEGGRPVSVFSVRKIRGEFVRLAYGDWVIREPAEQRRNAYPNGEGRAYPCKRDVFERHFEQIGE